MPGCSVSQGLIVAGLCLVSCGGVVLFSALILPGYIDKGFRALIEESVIWGPDATPDTYARYKRNDGPNDDPDYVKVWLFNLTNHEDVRKGAVPHVEEVGPYVYKKIRVRHNVTFEANNTLVLFKEYFYYTLVPELSSGDPEEDMIITQNIPLAGALTFIQSRSGRGFRFLLDLAAQVIEQWKDPNVMGLFMRRSASDLLWGYEDRLLLAVNRLLAPVHLDFHIPTGFSLVENSTSLAAVLQEPFTVMTTGADNIAEINSFTVWRNVTHITSWNNYSEPVAGTDGLQFRPGLTANDSVQVWAGELYRSARLVVAKQSEVRGLKALRFEADPALLAPDPRFFQTIPGLANITAPRAGGLSGKSDVAGPLLYLSMPHFCQADPSLSKQVTGLHCKPEQHTLFLEVEPLTGATVNAAKRLMLSTEYGPWWVGFDPHVRRAILPVFWAEEASQIGEEEAQALAETLYTVLEIETDIKDLGWLLAAAIAGLGLLLMVLSSVLICTSRPSYIAGIPPLPRASSPPADRPTPVPALVVPASVPAGVSMEAGCSRGDAEAGLGSDGNSEQPGASAGLEATAGDELRQPLLDVPPTKPAHSSGSSLQAHPV